MNNLITPMGSAMDELDLVVQTKYEELKEKYQLGEEYVFEFEGPNMVFKSSTFQYVVSVLKFKKKGNVEYKDVLGWGRILLVFNKDFDKKDVETKLEKAAELTIKLAQAGIKHEVGQHTLIYE